MRPIKRGLPVCCRISEGSGNKPSQYLQGSIAPTMWLAVSLADISPFRFHVFIIEVFSIPLWINGVIGEDQDKTRTKTVSSLFCVIFLVEDALRDRGGVRVESSERRVSLGC